MRTWAAVLLVLVLLLGGYGVYASFLAEPAVETASAPATARVRQGDLLISLAGSGELAAQEIPLAFPITGQISEINLRPGDTVTAGETLARLDSRQAELDLKAAQLTWDTLTSPQAAAQAQQELLVLQQELTAAQEELAYIQNGPPVWYYEELLAQAKAEYDELYQQFLSAVRRGDRQMARKLDRQVERAWQGLEKARQELEWAEAYQPDAQALALAEARASLAAARLAAQEELLSVLSGGPLPAAGAISERNAALLTLEKASLALQKAQWTVEQAALAAPATGTIAQVLAAPGERASDQPVLVLSTQDQLQARFYLEETDLALVAPGMRVVVRLDAYPAQALAASVVQVDSMLVAVDGSLMVQVWAEFDSLPEATLYPGMSLEVEVIAAEANDALLAPLQALRQSPDGAYFVEVLQPDGAFKAVPVTTGLRDLANVQILSGLQAGDQVSILSK